METNTATIANSENPQHAADVRAAIDCLFNAMQCMDRARYFAATENGLEYARSQSAAIAQQIEALYAYLGE